MSKNNTTDGAEDSFPRVNTTPIGSGITPGGEPVFNAQVGQPARPSSDGFREALYSQTFDGKRSLYDALGYLKDPEYRHFRARYERSDTATALVDRLPKDAWEEPTIHDDTETDRDAPTEFEDAVQSFLSGDYTRQDPIEVFQRVTRMERLGEFALIFIGFDDAAVSEGDAESLANPVEEGSVSGPEDIQYLTPYDEGRIDPDEFTWVTDVTDPRFGRPDTYWVDLGDDRPNAQIHHSRVIHVVGRVFDDELRSNSILEQSINRIDDIEKVLGASAEAFWRTAYQGFVVKPPTINGTTAEFGQGKSELAEQIDDYIHNYRRAIFANGDIETLDASTDDPSGHLESQYRALAAGHDIPQSILMGNETGERATQEDRQLWHERVASFRREYNEPHVLRAIIDHLTELGVFPEPTGDGYWFEWPPQDEPTAQERAGTENTRSQTINNMGQESLDTAAKAAYIEDGEFPERVHEQESLPAEAVAVENFDTGEWLDESDERVSEHFTPEWARMNETEFSEGDPVDTPNGRGVVVAVATEPIEGEDAEGVAQTVEASEESPTYLVVVEDGRVGSDFYKADELEDAEIETDVENPTEDLERMNEDEWEIVMRGLFVANSDWNPPRSWRQAEKPARLIAIDAFISMGASFDGCVREMRGSVTTPNDFCGAFLDYIYGHPYWRGKSPLPGK